MINLIPSYAAQENTKKALDNLRQSDSFRSYLSLIFDTIRKASHQGKLGTEIKLEHELMNHIPEEVLLALLGESLIPYGYTIAPKRRGRIRKFTSIQIIWGLPPKENK